METLRLPEDLERIVDPALLHRPDGLTVACWVYPQWHPTAFNDRLYGKGWTEYIEMRGARPWFPGHHQPRTPLLGELNEREPSTWETYVDLAADSGIDAFVFDWYWYNDQPVLHEALEEGLLNARNLGRMKFAVMLTNHPWAIWFPTMGYRPKDDWLAAWETSGQGGYELLYPAPETYEDVWRSMSYIIARYCHHPQYWRIDDEPVLPIWDFSLIVRNFGVDGAKQLLDDLCSFARKLGHKGLYFHAECQEPGVASILGDLEQIGVRSYSYYNAIAVAASGRPDEEEILDYGVLAADTARNVWPELDKASPLPCFPNLNPGCDNAPRVLMRPRGETTSRAKWPGTPIAINNTPAVFEAFVRSAFGYLNQRPQIRPILTIGCWNEWTEGHYLLPDTLNGFGMLRALARALGRGGKR